MFSPNLNYGEVIDNQELCDIFECSPQGGMRRSLRTDTLVLVCNHVQSPYLDGWIGDILHYSGMGSGNQDLNTTQNKTLYETYVHHSQSPAVFLFEVHTDRKYTYRGPVEVAYDPYTIQDNNRTVWVFPLKLKGTNPVIDKSVKISRNRGLKRPRADIFDTKMTKEQGCFDS